MAQTSNANAPRRAAGHATAAVLLGAGLACAGNAHASAEALATENSEVAGNAAVAIPTAIDMTALPPATELAELVERVADPPSVPSVVAEIPQLPDAPIVAQRVARAAPVSEPVVVAAVAEAPARVVPVDKASVARHHPSEDPLAVAMTLAHRNPGAAVPDVRKQMAKWKPVAQARLEESRGGFDAGGLQVGFGIDRAVFVNGALAVSTSITIPDISSITAAQAAQLAHALGQVTVAVTVANSAANAAVAAAQSAAGAAGQAGQAAVAAANGAAASAQGAAGTASSTASAAATGASAMAAGAAGVAQQAVANAAGTVVTNGLLTVIQNGAGNTANLGAVSNMPGTVIQNNLNNQNIQSLMTLNASVNTLAAFRTQMANTALNSVLQRSAAMR
ncbi:MULTISPECIES: hypothetical protein [unclassified Cupriavidus]|uniref:hypothetical protein n=1 Tax=unclassified Cupriavidus TaxID=2640874 RepID=UPI001C006513|nr:MULTISPECIES: hypothetical protein [unclassified Cupriavidus]MCA3184267.1 hypothetical protein [Cupriavidus sp.]MCA3193493.1 hypothetical protein [Cupriavidus sp.]MCA3199598.1 hypothetical protein [Cupriavidus sp.]MCA3203370.1 hypothetical protein [Cupriavidus sp.]MCA3210553.1 hypothetical protein [Cupriavidus sp.]